MVEPPVSGNLPSLLSTTIRRSISQGRLFLVIGIVYPVAIALILSASGERYFDSTVPLLLPILSVQGSMGVMITFSNDRMKGVFEYLIAYGVRPRILFATSLIASMAVMTILVGVSVGAVLGVSLVVWHGIPLDLSELVGLYSIPMSYTSAGLACMEGMYWTALSSPRGGMNSPIGLMPMVGVAPSALTWVVVEGVEAKYGTGATLVVLGVALALILGLTLTLLSLVGRLLRFERLLSPM